MQKNANLARLLRPKSIAVIGGGAWCKSVIEQCLKIGFKGPIWPVHPTKKKMANLATYSDVSQLPKAPDAVFIGVNRHALIDILPSLDEMGAGGAVCFASGFQETGEAKLHTDLLAAAGGMALLGPNCYGFINYLDHCALWPDQHGGKAAKSGVAIITQSSNIGLNITMQRRGLPLAYMITVGNQAQTGMAEVASQLLDDKRVTALGLHVEGFSDIKAFEDLAKKSYRLQKPVIVLKVGRSPQARAASVSHTASLAGSDAGAQAFIERLGLARAKNLPQFLESLKLVHLHGRLSGTRLTSLSCSGGEASLIADAAQSQNITFPPLTKTRKAHLDRLLGELVTLANPLDYHTDIWRDQKAMAAVFASMSGPDIDLTLIVLDFPHQERCDDNDWLITIKAIENAAAQTGRPFAVVSSLPENLPEKYTQRLLKNNIVSFSSIDDALAAANCAAKVLTKPAAKPVLIPRPLKNTKTISEFSAKKALASFGLQSPASCQITNSSQLTHKIKNLCFPVVLKGQGFAHKTEAGAVALNLANITQLKSAAKKMNANSFVVEEQICDGVIELLVGVTIDPAHGYLLTIATGGVLTEILRDSQTLLVPTTKTQISAALGRLKSSPLIFGFRGKPAADKPAIITAIIAIQNYVIANQGRIAEIEINPLICTPINAIAADALISKGK